MILKFLIPSLMRLRVFFWLGVFLALEGCVFAQEDSFYNVVSNYEEKMDLAAKSWLNKNYSRALDGFYAARELLSKNMPTPLDPYGWGWCRSMKTYTVVLARMVEVDLYRSKGEVDLVSQIAVQALEWARVLKEQASAWLRFKAQSPEEILIRNRWLKRFRTAILQAQKVSRDFMKKK